MAREPSKPNGRDPQVTDLRRYRKEREKAARRPPRTPPAGGKGGRESLLGSNPRAGLILVLVIVVLALLYLGPRFL